MADFHNEILIEKIKNSRVYTGDSEADVRRKNQILGQQLSKEMKTAEDKWMNEQCEKIEREFNKGNSKEAYKTISQITKTEQPRTSVIEDKDGHILTENEAVLNRWTEYCKDLYNYELKVDKESLGQTQDRETDPQTTQILRVEEEEAVKQMKNGKSPGIDNLPGELIKNGGPAMIDAFNCHLPQNMDHK